MSQPLREFQEVSVVCLVLLDAEGRFMATQRPDDKPLPNLWEFPGGKVEECEDDESALRREIQEELELKVGHLEPLEPVVYDYEDWTIKLSPFLARCVDHPLINLTEHTDVAWVTPSEAVALSWAPADIPILRQLDSFV